MKPGRDSFGRAPAGGGRCWFAGSDGRPRWEWAGTAGRRSRREPAEKGLGGRRLQVAETRSDERVQEVVERLLRGAYQVGSVEAGAAKRQL